MAVRTIQVFARSNVHVEHEDGSAPRNGDVIANALNGDAFSWENPQDVKITIPAQRTTLTFEDSDGALSDDPFSGSTVSDQQLKAPVTINGHTYNPSDETTRWQHDNPPVNVENEYEVTLYDDDGTAYRMVGVSITEGYTTTVVGVMFDGPTPRPGTVLTYKQGISTYSGTGQSNAIQDDDDWDDDDDDDPSNGPGNGQDGDDHGNNHGHGNGHGHGHDHHDGKPGKGGGHGHGHDHDHDVPCFLAGTLIDTPSGPVPVERLKAGDLVTTMDHGPQPLRWAGSSTAFGRGAQAPVRLCLENGGGGRDLWVSPNHRVLLRSPLAELHFGSCDVLVPAKGLIGHPSVCKTPLRQAQYVHLLFDRHEVVFSDGIATESLFAGSMALDALGADARAELREVLPEDRLREVPLCRTALTLSEARCLLGELGARSLPLVRPRKLHQRNRARAA